MSEAGFPLYLLKITESFLSCRRFRVYVGNTSSGFRNLTVGIPQGSVLSPTMFNIYIHDALVPPDSILAEFADDSAYLTASHRTPTIRRRLEAAASRAVRYFAELGISVNGPKSAAMIFSRKLADRHRTSRNLVVDGVADVFWSNTIKYLGLRLDRKLTFSSHVQDLNSNWSRIIS